MCYLDKNSNKPQATFSEQLLATKMEPRILLPGEKVSNGFRQTVRANVRIESDHSFPAHTISAFMDNPQIPHNLPHWAHWLAQDADGSWWAFEAEPNEYDHGWYENEVGRCQRLGEGKANSRWRESLRRSSAP